MKLYSHEYKKMPAAPYLQVRDSIYDGYRSPQGYTSKPINGFEVPYTGPLLMRSSNNKWPEGAG